MGPGCRGKYLDIKDKATKSFIVRSPIICTLDQMIMKYRRNIRVEQNLFTFHRSFIVQAKDVEHVIIGMPTLSTNKIPI
jgi:hypothetical protein